ncbi:hypothetical protein ROV67_00015 [Pasteurella multocida]|uniref:hypothetical protein n=1 Tax=Pasteurella multocida TaxID=747 RepID=UPI0007EC8A52|nr:hypothetical protein [Pasteurella multocida]AWY03348.1 hypothetical protein [Pasteurella phage Pm86]MCL7822581.1 hypothetical protein [Pasteurella multocida]MDY0633759.1 hypothetical protein [Pasteurella multocida]MDY0692500.1 hypothetical protein [Pasteurella multocida]MEB3481289.1 hypothetical protein [Pasteurella multocida]
MTQLTANQEKAIRAFKFSFTNQGVFNVDQLVAYFEAEGDDTETKTFLATAYALNGAYESGYFDIDNAEAQLEALNGYGVDGFDFDKALELCEVFFDLVEKGLYEVE